MTWFIIGCCIGIIKGIMQRRKMKSIRTGKLRCAVCGSEVQISTFRYGGMKRWVCTEETCINSETALDLETTNEM